MKIKTNKLRSTIIIWTILLIGLLMVFIFSLNKGTLIVLLLICLIGLDSFFEREPLEIEIKDETIEFTFLFLKKLRYSISEISYKEKVAVKFRGGRVETLLFFHKNKNIAFLENRSLENRQLAIVLKNKLKLYKT